MGELVERVHNSMAPCCSCAIVAAGFQDPVREILRGTMEDRRWSGTTRCRRLSKTPVSSTTSRLHAGSLRLRQRPDSVGRSLLNRTWRLGSYRRADAPELMISVSRTADLPQPSMQAVADSKARCSWW